MALPTKQGIRKLRIGPTEYYWKLVRPDQPILTIVIGVVADQNCRLLVLTDWAEPWLTFGDSPRPATGIVTPGLVRRCIDYGLTQQWGPVHRTLTLNYHNDAFSVSPTPY